jgi:hypothetical protein
LVFWVTHHTQRRFERNTTVYGRLDCARTLHLIAAHPKIYGSGRRLSASESCCSRYYLDCH